MSCQEPGCRLNDTLLALLPELDLEQQRRVLEQWPDLSPVAREQLVRDLTSAPPPEADLVALSKLADYFQCGVYDMVRYTRLHTADR